MVCMVLEWKNAFHCVVFRPILSSHLGLNDVSVPVGAVQAVLEAYLRVLEDTGKRCCTSVLWARMWWRGMCCFSYPFGWKPVVVSSTSLFLSCVEFDMFRRMKE